MKRISYNFGDEILIHVYDDNGSYLYREEVINDVIRRYNVDNELIYFRIGASEMSYIPDTKLWLGNFPF